MIPMRVMPWIMLGAVLWGCAGTRQSATPAQLPSGRAARPANRYIYVTDRNLPGECYTDLGPVQFTQPFADAAVDPDQSEARRHLREAARKIYPDDVDAVINMKSEQNDVGTEVTVSGEAVRLEDHPTVQCALRGGEHVMDEAAVVGAGAIAGTTVGGLTGGSTGAMGGAAVGAGAMGTRELMQHQASLEQQQADFEKTLADQRREITRLLKQRAQLRKCQEQEITVAVCLAAPAPPDSAGQESNNSDQDVVDASPFQIQKHLQEQQDYIKRLKDEIAQIKWQMRSR